MRPRAGVVAAGLAAVYPPLVTIPAYAFSETLYSVVAFAAIVVLQRSVDGDPANRGGSATVLALTAGLLGGAAALIRPAMLLFMPLAFVWLLGRRKPALAAALTAGVVVMVLPWTIRNVDLYGRIGWGHSELKFNANGPLNTSNQNERQDEAAYGVGARWWFARNWGVFAEWAKNDRIRVDSYVAGIDFRF